MDLVKFKRQLARADLERKLGELLEQKVKSLPDYDTLKLNPELILLVARLVEEGTDKQLCIDKKELVMKVLDNIFGYSESDKRLLDDQIEFLHATKKIKKVKLTIKILHYVWDWIKRHWL
jgi:hypothetical protein